MAPWYPLPGMCTKPLLIPAAGGMAEPQIAQQSIHCKILTAGETLMLVGILAGILMLAGVLTKTLKLVGFLIGILILARILSRIPTVATTLAGIATPVGTAKLEKIKTSDRTESQSWTGLKPIKARTLPRTLTLAAMLRSEEIEISDRTEYPSRTQLKLPVAEHTPD